VFFGRDPLALCGQSERFPQARFVAEDRVGNHFPNGSEHATDTKPRHRFGRRTEFIPFLSVFRTQAGKERKESRLTTENGMNSVLRKCV
jgi:hypothetical protein